MKRAYLALIAPGLFAGLQFIQPPASAASTAPAGASRHASGSFDVNTAPAGTPDTQAGATIGRYTLDKQYHGDLAGSGKGEMLTAVSATPGSAAYVAIERVSGTLHGREGSFAVHHTGTRSAGKQQLAIAIVPDSGSGQLAGISGTMDIQIVDGKHRYSIEYRLP